MEGVGSASARGRGFIVVPEALKAYYRPSYNCQHSLLLQCISRVPNQSITINHDSDAREREKVQLLSAHVSAYF